MDREPSPNSPVHQAAPPPRPAAHQTHTCTSSPLTRPRTTQDSNLALLQSLSTATSTRPALPIEIILQILDHPTRWIHIYSIYHPPLPNSHPAAILSTSNEPTGNPVLYTRALSARDIKLLRKIVFTFRSRDQGWCSDREQGNWSWFEASSAQLSGEDEVGQTQISEAVVDTGHYHWIRPWTRQNRQELKKQPRYKIGMNRIAENDPADHTVELTGDHELVQRVREGDRIILWACACFPGWQNYVYEAKISIEGADDLSMERAQGHQ